MNEQLTSSSALENTANKALAAHRVKLESIAATATPADRETAKRIATSPEPFARVEIYPVVAAILALEHNGANRTLKLPKVLEFQAAMDRGEWKYHHQGIAFYADGTVADGQHRLNGNALSTRPIDVVVSHNFDQNAIDAIDRSGRRTAGEALEMRGIRPGADKAAIGKTVMEYAYEADNRSRGKFTDPQVESFVADHDSMLDEALRIGDNSTKHAASVLTTKEAATIAMLLLYGKWPATNVIGFVHSLQTSETRDEHPDSPAALVSVLYEKAKSRAAVRDTLTRTEKLALAIKAAHMTKAGVTTKRMAWNPKKEPLPSYRVDGLVSA